MQRLIPLCILISILIVPAATYAGDFSLSDFDAADYEQSEAYIEATLTLIDDLTAEYRDAHDNLILSVLPFPMELVAISTQSEIHTFEMTDEDELLSLIDQANNDKPSLNSFSFVLHGDPEIVTQNIYIYYFMGPEDETGVMVPAIWVMDGELAEDNTIASQWVFMAEDPNMIVEFMSASEVYLVAGDPDEEYIQLDIGFWRQWSLFDADMAETVESE